MTYTLAVAGAFERRTANDTSTPSAINTHPNALTMILSSVRFSYSPLKKEKKKKSLKIYKMKQ